MVDEVACPRCGHIDEPGGNFCSVCGAALPVPPAAAETTAAHPAIPPTAADGGVPTLVVTRGANAGSRYVLGDVTTIGRHPDSEVFLDDVTVSRRHAEIRRDPTGLSILDAGSLNGTYVNGARVEQGPLAEADQLQIGKFRLVVVLAGEG